MNIRSAILRQSPQQHKPQYKTTEKECRASALLVFRMPIKLNCRLVVYCIRWTTTFVFCFTDAAICDMEYAYTESQNSPSSLFLIPAMFLVSVGRETTRLYLLLISLVLCLLEKVESNARTKCTTSVKAFRIVAHFLVT